MELISKGGYSEVFYDPVHKEVYRRSYKYLQDKKHHDKAKEIDTSSINDLIFTKSFQYKDHTPVIHSETVCEKYLSFRMSHYGKPLHQWVHDHPNAIRKKYAPQIILEIIRTCLYFQKNAFFHSDLKPSNIMIDTVLCDPSESDEENTINPKDNIKKIHTRIIDFNSSSVRIIHEENSNIQWTNTIGTWNYCAPEIILYETPDMNSSSWTIGLIASIIIDTYAFNDFVNKDIQHTLAPQETWRKLLGDLYMKYPNHPPLSRNDWYEEPWQKLIWNCTHWCQSKRWDLFTLYQYVYNNLLEDADKLLYDNPMILYDHIPSIEYFIPMNQKLTYERRNQMIQLMFNLCIKIKRINLFPTAVSIFDRSESIISDDVISSNINQVAGACLLISACIFDVNILSSKRKLSLLIQFFTTIHLDDMIKYIYIICKHLEWKIWEKPVHIIINDNNSQISYNKQFWQHIKEGFIQVRHSYTQYHIAEYVIRCYITK